MKMKSIVLGLAAAVTVAAPIGTVAAQRAVAPVEEGSEIGSGSTIVLALLGAAAVIGGIVALSDSNDDPVSA